MSTTINKNLGHVTAYAYAKAGGYTGTEAEFEALLGNVAIDLSEIENLSVVVTTLPAGSDATARYEDGTIYLGVPRGDTGEVSDADLAEALEDYVEKTTLDDYAQVDGYYSDMTVGDAEQLIASQYVEDSEPYGYRTTGGSADVGNREYVDAIVGGTVNWNQKADELTLANKWKVNESFGTATYGDNSIKYTITSKQASQYIGRNSGDGGLPLIQNHKYFIGFGILSTEALTSISSYVMNDQVVYCGAVEANAFIRKERIFNSTQATGGNAFFGIYPNLAGGGMNVGMEFTISDLCVFDLTAMLGTTIADYIYGLEQANAGAGVAWFKKLFPKDYYEYNAGELISVSGLQSHDMIGFNQWDEEWEVGAISSNGQPTGDNNNIRSKNFIPVIPQTQYYIKVPMANASTPFTVIICGYDAEKSFVKRIKYSSGNAVFTTSDNNIRFIKFCTLVTGGVNYGNTYNHDICINLSWSGWRNGEYEPYQKHSYPLDPSKVMRGIFMLDEQNRLYSDGDIYPPSGEFQRRYILVDLGTLNWEYNSTTQQFRAGLPQPPKSYTASETPNAICSRYIAHSQSVLSNGQMSIYYASVNGVNIIDSAYTDAAAFKTAMSGVMLLYEAQTPTIESAEPYQHIQICDDFGTEEFVSTSIVPVGHQTRYPSNLRDKLQHLPNLADNDGYYMIGQTNKQMSLELFRIPKAPTTDGTYTLKATVSGGTPTYTWEVEVEE